MKISELIEKLQKAKEKYGDIDVLMECGDDVNINTVAYVDPNGRYNDFGHIRLTDGDTDDIYYLYDEDPDDAEDMDVEEID